MYRLALFVCCTTAGLASAESAVSGSGADKAPESGQAAAPVVILPARPVAVQPAQAAVPVRSAAPAAPAVPVAPVPAADGQAKPVVIVVPAPPAAAPVPSSAPAPAPIAASPAATGVAPVLPMPPAPVKPSPLVTESVPAATAPVVIPAVPVQPAEHKAASAADLYKGVVKVEVSKRSVDYRTPWRSGQFGSGTGTAFLVGKGLFMTNAHVVSNADRIYLSQYGDSRKIPAEVKFVAHDADLALVEVADPKPFEGMTVMEFSKDLPKLEDEVRVIGYPMGGNRLSVTRGIVSRIDFTAYAHPRSAQHLTLQVDAAINPGNSGGPVFKGDQVIGVAFQGLNNANSTGYVIPTPVIARFLKDVQDGHYDGYVDLGAELEPIGNPAQRKVLGLPDDEKGVLVSDLIKGGPSDGVLEIGDVILKVDGHDVDSSGMVLLGGERVLMNELVERRFAGDRVKMQVKRGGKLLDLAVALKTMPTGAMVMQEYDKLPRYVTYGGLVFQPLQFNVVEANKISEKQVILPVVDFQQEGGWMKKDDVVLMTNVLEDEVNSKISGYGTSVLTKVNGVEVKGLKHLNELLYPKDGKLPEFMVFEFADAVRPVVFQTSMMDKANARISKNYAIPAPARLDSSWSTPDAPPAAKVAPVRKAAPVSAPKL